MSKISRARKREIRSEVRELVATFIREGTPIAGYLVNADEFDYALKEVEEIAGRINYQKSEGDAE